MQSETMSRDMARNLYCYLNGIDWDQEKVEQTDHFERWYATVKAALSAAEPVVCEYGQDNGDGTYSPTYARWPLPTHVKPHSDMPIKLFYAAPPAPSVAVKALHQAASDFMHLFIQDGQLTVQGLEDTDLIPAYEKLSAALSAQVQDVARDLPSEFEKWWDDAGHYVGGVVKMTYTQRKQLAWDAFYASANPAAPAKQEG